MAEDPVTAADIPWGSEHIAPADDANYRTLYLEALALASALRLDLVVANRRLDAQRDELRRAWGVPQYQAHKE